MTLIISILLLTISTANAEDAKFHTPQTEAEKALDNIIKINNKNYDLFNFLLKREWYKKETEQKYSILFTKDFLEVIVREDRKLAAKYCGDDYDASKGACRFDYNPVTCEQFGGKNYEYKTIEETKEFAIVAYSADGEDIYDHKYRLLNDNGKWMLDGVKCSKDVDYDRDLNFTKN